MRKEIPGGCPVCGERMHVRELGCRSCDITIRGEFEMSPFSALTREELRFVEIFIRSQGNLREVQAEIGQSYPTVKKALDNVIRRLGYDVRPDAAPASETTDASTGTDGASGPETDGSEPDVLGKLKNREITVEEAVARLKVGRK